jgi:hypothetical protein
MRISQEAPLLQIVIDHKQLENVEYFNHLDSMIRNNARCKREIKSRPKKKKSIQQEEGRKLRQEGN